MPYTCSTSTDFNGPRSVRGGGDHGSHGARGGRVNSGDSGGSGRSGGLGGCRGDGGGGGRVGGGHRGCCCLPTTMTLAIGGSPIFPLVVHQPASPSIWPAVQSLWRCLSRNPGMTMWCVCGCS